MGLHNLFSPFSPSTLFIDSLSVSGIMTSGVILNKKEIVFSSA